MLSNMSTYFVSLIIINGFLFNVNCIKFEEHFAHIRPISSDNVQQKAIEKLIERIIPQYSKRFLIGVNSSLSTDKDIFIIESSNGQTVNIFGNTGVAAATGFNYFLKYSLNCHISWQISQLNIPERFPKISIKKLLNDKFRYYQNVCTTSYSFVWWSWPLWEKHIDWIVLNSFNLVLAFNGQEAIWKRVYEQFNLTDVEIDEHFSGPAFLSWSRMGNIRGWGGKLSENWHKRSIILQKLIVKQLREFGVYTVLPAFAGHVPRAFKRIYPDVKMDKVDVWNKFNDTFCCPYFLHPTESLFQNVGESFMKEQLKEFGTDHFYNSDSFNENNPSSTDLVYIRKVGESIYNAMQAVDDKAIWILQGWMLHHNADFWTNERAKSFLTSVSLGKMIVLDLQSEQFPMYDIHFQYYGQPYIWCMLHNFGGTLGMFGSLDIINQRPIEARNSEGSTMIGIGLTPEGINQNYIVYDFMIENAWRTKEENISSWIENYVRRRYGKFNYNAVKSWKILGKSVYNYKGLLKMRGQYAITRTPGLNIKTWTWYSEEDLLEAWENLLNASHELNSPGFRHDLVDLTRQFLQLTGDNYYNKIIEAFNKKNFYLFNLNSEIFLSIFKDLEEILSTDKAFLLGPWLEMAKSTAETKADEKLFEYNARNQITLWGPKGEIRNYANKQWAGIVSDYFLKRWSLYLNCLGNYLKNGTKCIDKEIKRKMFEEIESPFTFSRKIYPVKPKGEAALVAGKIYQKWNNRTIKAFREKRDSFEEENLPEFNVVIV